MLVAQEDEVVKLRLSSVRPVEDMVCSQESAVSTAWEPAGAIPSSQQAA